jgi:flagellar hook-associated protein 3 FlgL
MRVTPNIMAENALYNLQQGRSRLGTLQEQIASELNYNRPSDEPIVAQQLLNLHDKLLEGKQYASNLTKANTWLNLTDTALEGISDTVSQVQSLAGTITSGSSDPSVRANTITQLDQLKKQLIDMGNTQFGDQYIFAGFKNDKPPFSTATNTYAGTADDINIDIDRGSPMPINLVGDNILTGGGGTVNILQQIDDLKNAVGANNITAIQTAARQLDQSSSQIDNARSDLAGKLIRVTNAQKSINRNDATVSGIISNIQNVDLVKAATELSEQRTAFEAALSATAKISQLSLLDFIR